MKLDMEPEKDLVKTLNRQRGALKAKITKIIEFVKDEEILKDDQLVLQMKLDSIEQIKLKLETLRLEYYKAVDDVDLPITEETFSSMENDIEEVEVSLLRLKTSIARR